LKVIIRNVRWPMQVFIAVSYSSGCSRRHGGWAAMRLADPEHPVASTPQACWITLMIEKSKPILVFAAGLIAAGALSGCTVGPDFERPGWASPSSWFSGPKEAVARPASVPVAGPVDVDWWTLFHDPILTGLERRVAAENLDMKIAATRLAQSRAQLGVARASLFPTVGGNVS
jgi:hypothetical protein